MSSEKRKYEMRQRAEARDRTRLRITEATMELHGSVGPARTSVSAIAERAGVRRSTVYRHFPDEASLFAACSAHWRAANPPPDLGTWAAIADPGERLAVALGELYPYYRGTARMRENLERDEHAIEPLQALLAGWRGYLDAAVGVLARGRGARGAGRRRLRAAIAHALAFATWRSLAVEQGLDDAEAARLMGGLVDGAA